jgi:hypothetical protein
MPKRLRDEPIYLAPEILGFRNESGDHIIKDLRTDTNLDPHNINDKIFIYKRQVEEWFLNQANILCDADRNNFLVVMITTSYIEGVEQYRNGTTSNGRSRELFSAGIRRIFGVHTVSQNQIFKLYKHLRCGLFHNGMVGDAVVLNRTCERAIEFSVRETININPILFKDAVIRDFNQYIFDLYNQNNVDLRDCFDRMFNVV